LDKTGSKGTGKWTVQEAAEKAVAAPAIASSLDARYLSARKEERVAASTILQGPSEYPNVSKPQILEDLTSALFCSKICSYAQGLDIIKTASLEHGWNIDLAKCARMWRGGCIIRAKLLESIAAAFTSNPSLTNLMVSPEISEKLSKNQLGWRRIVTLCIASGIPCPTLASSLNYYDTYRRASLPANLTQAQRDFFGGHTYERIDKPDEGPFHCVWTSNHKGIGDVKARTAGEKDLSHM